MKRLFIFFISLFLLSSTAYGSDLQIKNCLNQIQQSIDDGDGNKFQELIAMDDILKNAMQIFLEQAQAPENAFALPPVIALMLSQNADGKVGDLILNETKSFILNSVNSGAFAGKNLNAGEKSGLLAPLFANASLGKKKITWIGSAEQNGADWLVPFAVYDYGNGNTYMINGRVALDGDSCKLIKIENFDQLFQQIAKEMN